jgi:hypothetical protein
MNCGLCPAAIFLLLMSFHLFDSICHDCHSSSGLPIFADPSADDDSNSLRTLQRPFEASHIPSQRRPLAASRGGLDQTLILSLAVFWVEHLKATPVTLESSELALEEDG